MRQMCLRVSVLCVVILFILGVRRVDAPTRVTQDSAIVPFRRRIRQIVLRNGSERGQRQEDHHTKEVLIVLNIINRSGVAETVIHLKVDEEHQQWRATRGNKERK